MVIQLDQLDKLDKLDQNKNYEFAIWGIKKGEKYESPIYKGLYDFANTPKGIKEKLQEGIEKYSNIIEFKYISIIDGLPNFNTL